MQNGLKCNERRRIWVDRTFKIEIQKGGPNNSDILQNWFPPEMRSPLFNLWTIENPERSTPESYKMHWNLMNEEEFESKKLLKLKYRREDQIIQTFCKIIFPPEIRSPLLSFEKFHNSGKILPDSWRMKWNLINDEEFGSKNLLKLKNRRGDQITQTFYKIGSRQKLGPPSLICRDFTTLRKSFLIHAEWTEIQWMRKNLGLF